MASRPLALAFLVAGLTFLCSPALAQAQQPARLPSTLHSSLRSPAAVPIHRMPSVDAESLRVHSQRDAGEIGPQRYGAVLETRLTASEHGLWEQLPSGEWVWRLRLHSEGAVSMSVGFTRFQLPAGASVYLHGPDGTDVRGPYTADDATASQHWTPLVRGSEIIIEMLVPEGRREEVQLEIGQVVHGYRPLLPEDDSGDLTKAGACNLDVACEEADPWRKQVRSVGRVSFEENGFAKFCSGALVNNTAQDKTPYFLTAEHCVSSPEVAATMVFYWNYQNSTCRPQGSPENGEVTDDPLGEQTSSGAILRARFGNVHRTGDITGRPDLSLVEIDDEIPESYNLYFSGWSREGTATARGVTIHHPQGHGKRISFDEDPTSITGFGRSDMGTTHLRVGNWELGTTEAGSSGAPLFDSNHQIVGVLSGGFAGCDLPGDNNRPDWYGRLALGFENGDYRDHTLADWLDPRNTGTDTLGGRPQRENADLIAPAKIQDLQISRVNTADQAVTLTWTATGDDNRTGTAQRYDLRFDTTRIDSRADFRQARRVTDLPPPAPANQPEQFVIDASDGLHLDRSYYFALVAVDDAGNRSPRATPNRKAVLVKEIDIEKGGLTTGGGAVTELRFVLNETQTVRVALYDLLGRRVRVLLKERIPEGFEQIVQIQTSTLSSGPYFLHFSGERFAATRKIVVTR